MLSSIVMLTIVAGLTVAALLFVAVRSRRMKAGGGELRLMGEVGSVEEELQPEGAVMVHGELWRARSRSGARVGRGRGNVRVVGARGHFLEVEEVASEQQ